MAIDVNDGAARWEIWLDDPAGTRLALLDNVISFSVSKIANNLGAFIITLPPIYDDLLRLDGMIEFWRAPAGAAFRFFNVGLMRRFEYADQPDGSEITILSGPDGMDLAKRRIIAYAAGEMQSAKTDLADDMLKAMVDENLAAAATDADRDLETLLSFSVQADLGAGPSVSRGFAWKNLLAEMRKIADDSNYQGTPLYFDIVPKIISSTKISFEFQTFTGQPGRDRTGADQVIFGKTWGNMANPVYTEDYMDEINYVYAGGQGEEADREIVEVEDAGRSGASIWNRREAFADARNENSTAGVTSKANEILNAGRPVKQFSCEILDTPQAVYGLDWEWGDKVVAEYRGRQFPAPVLVTGFAMNERRQEEITARLEVVE